MKDLQYFLSDLITDSVCLHFTFSFCSHCASYRNVAESLGHSEDKGYWQDLWCFIQIILMAS